VDRKGGSLNAGQEEGCEEGDEEEEVSAPGKRGGDQTPSRFSFRELTAPIAGRSLRLIEWGDEGDGSEEGEEEGRS
jgi:hypothetical protein